MAVAQEPSPVAVKILLGSGADPDRLDLCGVSARDHAEATLASETGEEEALLVREVLGLLRAL